MIKSGEQNKPKKKKPSSKSREFDVEIRNIFASVSLTEEATKIN